jgi:hypothetical protein
MSNADAISNADLSVSNGDNRISNDGSSILNDDFKISIENAQSLKCRKESF